MKIPVRKLSRFYEKTIHSNVVQSVRRLIFTHCSQSMEELGRYHADTVYNLGGTGILIKYHQKFFLLTAQHVLDAHYEIAQNESPFITHLFSNRGWIGAEDLGIPMRGWRIGELIKADMPNIDMQDIVLVELASLFRFPNTFIDLDSPNAPKGVPVRNLSKGMLLIASGYPIDENPIEYPYGDDYNCSTVINKHITFGGCEFDGSTPILRFHKEKTHAMLNGMSVGLVSNLMPKSNQVEWVGMVQKAGNSVLHFYPACWIIPAIRAYTQASHYVIDPAVLMTNLEFDSSPEAVEGRRSFYQRIKKFRGQSHHVEWI